MLARMLMNDAPFARLSREMDRVLARPFPSVAGPTPGTGVPALNAWQDDSALHIEAELPGYALENVEILAQDQSLTLRGSREIVTPEGAAVLRAERVAGAFERTLELPVPISVDAVQATLRDGVLHITLPLAEQVRPRRVTIQVAPQN